MQLSKHKSIALLFIGVIFLIFLFLVSLPAMAGSVPQAYTGSDPGDSATISVSTDVTGTLPTRSPQPILTTTYTNVLTETNTPNPSDFTTPIITSSLTLTPTVTATPMPTQISYLPIIHKEPPIPTETPTPISDHLLFCDNISAPIHIPDNNSTGIKSDINVTDSRLLVNARLYLDISHTYVGDLVVTLTNLSSNQTVKVLDRPGSQPDYCPNSDIVTILDDSAIQFGDDQCASSPNAISGIYRPVQNLSKFFGVNASGTWRLNISDRAINDTGSLNHWCIEARLSDTMPDPTPAPTPVNLPSSANVSGMSGANQALKLDCESRSAVDWARKFGYDINELHFQNRLPVSDDPEAGFVGNPNGTWGYMPPNDYGVHAPPIAKLLREYGLTASSFKSLTWDDLRSQIASGKPAIVWIIGDNFRNIVIGTPHYYSAASTGNLTVVAPHEHTVIVVGYTPSYVTVLNGASFFNIPIDQFLDSWSALDFMAVLAR